MVKKLSLAKSTQELEEKAENVKIDEKADEATLLRYIKSANAVFTNAESVYQKGDEEQAYVYFVKFFHVYSQLRSTIAYISKNKAVTNEMSSLLPISKCKTALSRAEKLKKSLSSRYKEREAAEMKEKEEKEERRKLEEERDRQLAEIERLKLEASQPSVDAATLFSSAAFSTPLLPMGCSPKDTIPKEPYISAIELMHIIEAKMKVLLIDVRTLDEFKNSHVIHEAVIFLSKDYLDINTKLTNSEIRELILMKDHKALWDKRGRYDVIVIFDSDSQYNSVAELSNSPINIVRECTTDCLDPNFINSDLPKVLDGGYASWVYHFPKHCTNPDRARKVKPVPKTRRSAPATLLPLTPAKAAAIYPELNKETEPKPLPVLPPEEPTPAASVVTCGNVQISMPQSPQTIQINQWNQEQHVLPGNTPEHNPPASYHTSRPLSESNSSHSSHSSFQAASHPATSLPSVPRTTLPSTPDTHHVTPDNTHHVTPDNTHPQPTDYTPRTQQSDLRPKHSELRTPPLPSEPRSSEQHVKPSKSDGSLRITDIYEGSPVTVPSSSSSQSSTSSQQMIREDAITTFPTKVAEKDPVYAQVEVRRKVPNHAVVSNSTIAPKPAEYADIRSIQLAVDRPTVDRSSKPKETPVLTVQPAARNRPQVDLTKPPAYMTNQPSTNDPSQLKQPHNLIQPTVPQPARPQPTKPTRPAHEPHPTRQQPAQPPATRPTRSQPTPPVKNPTVNRVVKPLSAKALEEKNMRMMPAYGSVQMGTCGLKNIGNTCFMNAVLQCLSAIAPLTKYFVSGQYKHEINADNPLGTKGLVAEEYAYLVRAMWSDRFRHLAPKDWKEAIGRFRPQFLDYSQKDSQEFTSFMLDALHEDLNRVQLSERKWLPEIDYSKMSYKEGARAAWDSYRTRNDSVVVDLFQGQFRNVTHCLRCGYESVTFDTFMYLTVPVGKSRTKLETCIENFCQKEKIEWRCDKCKVLGDATKSITIWRLPTILVVILKRFSYSGMWRDKISTFVDFPVSNFRALAREVSWISNPEEGRVFRLFGVTNHTGTLEGGHYIGCARNPLSGDWFTYDDHVIRPMRAEQTKKKEAYLLFYTSLGEHDDIKYLNFAR